ncbi:uncharacterized protein LOC134206075 [Armigeres subalbatus]|uniref:uncharacterized protein LOC134206075 n=1 Tax=Armigeres subalbatus TaxID=124917 RepID=UPI002ED1F68B
MVSIPLMSIEPKTVKYREVPYRSTEARKEGHSCCRAGTKNTASGQTRNLLSRTVESSQSPRQSDSVQSNQVIHAHAPYDGPTQRQLAARQSLAKELPRFSGDPAEWPIFISKYRYTTEACGFSEGENMLRLQRCLTGPALEAVRSRLVLPAAVPQVMETHRMRFGRPELLINALLRRVRDIPAPKSDRLDQLIDFGMAVQALSDHIEAANERAHLSNPALLQELVTKLPADQPFESEVKRSNPRDRPKGKGFVNSHAVETPRSGESTREPQDPSKHFDCTHCNKSGHRLRDCAAFKQLHVDDRWRRIRSLGLCQNCLFNHGRRACRGRKPCNIEDCQFRHHPLLHSTRTLSKSLTSGVGEHHTHRHSSSSTLFRIIPVTLHGILGSIDTYAFLDEGSDLTLVESDLAISLGVKGTPRPLCLRWTGNTSRIEKGSQQITFEISGIGQCKRHRLLNARTVDNLGLPSQSFCMEEAVKMHKHLNGIPLSSYQNAVPKILIGVDNLRLALPLKVQEGDGMAPVAVKTRLGWCVYGPRGRKNLGYNFHICECSCDETLHGAVKDFFAIESVGAESVIIPRTNEDMDYGSNYSVQEWTL